MDRLTRGACLGFALGVSVAVALAYAAWVRWTTEWDEQ